MINKQSLRNLIIEALQANNGSATIVPICKYVWDNYESQLKESGALFYTWQYDIRWAADALRRDGKLKPAYVSPKGIWELSS